MFASRCRHSCQPTQTDDLNLYRGIELRAPPNIICFSTVAYIATQPPGIGGGGDGMDQDNQERKEIDVAEGRNYSKKELDHDDEIDTGDVDEDQEDEEEDEDDVDDEDDENDDDNDDFFYDGFGNDDSDEDDSDDDGVNLV